MLDGDKFGLGDVVVVFVGELILLSNLGEVEVELIVVVMVGFIGYLVDGTVV